MKPSAANVCVRKPPSESDSSSPVAGSNVIVAAAATRGRSTPPPRDDREHRAPRRRSGFPEPSRSGGRAPRAHRRSRAPREARRQSGTGPRALLRRCESPSSAGRSEQCRSRPRRPPHLDLQRVVLTVQRLRPSHDRRAQAREIGGKGLQLRAREQRARETDPVPRSVTACADGDAVLPRHAPWRGRRACPRGAVEPEPRLDRRAKRSEPGAAVALKHARVPELSRSERRLVIPTAAAAARSSTTPG